MINSLRASAMNNDRYLRVTDKSRYSDTERELSDEDEQWPNGNILHSSTHSSVAAFANSFPAKQSLPFPTAPAKGMSRHTVIR